MTFIQPNKNSTFMHIVLFGLLCLLVVVAFSLIVFYNKVVNFEHGITQAKLDLKEIQAENIEVKDKIFNLIDSSKSQILVSRGLVQDKNPAYFAVNPKWSYASQY